MAGQLLRQGARPAMGSQLPGAAGQRPASQLLPAGLARLAGWLEDAISLDSCCPSPDNSCNVITINYPKASYRVHLTYSKLLCFEKMVVNCYIWKNTTGSEPFFETISGSKLPVFQNKNW